MLRACCLLKLCKISENHYVSCKQNSTTMDFEARTLQYRVGGSSFLDILKMSKMDFRPSNFLQNSLY